MGENTTAAAITAVVYFTVILLFSYLFTMA